MFGNAESVEERLKWYAMAFRSNYKVRGVHRAIAEREHEWDTHWPLYHSRTSVAWSVFIATAMSVQNYRDFEKGNSVYIGGFGGKGSLPIPPGKKLAVGSLSLSLCPFIAFISYWQWCSDLYGCSFKVEWWISYNIFRGLISYFSPESHLGLKEGDAHVIRNAGGIASVDLLCSGSRTP